MQIWPMRSSYYSSNSNLTFLMGVKIPQIICKSQLSNPMMIAKLRPPLILENYVVNHQFTLFFFQAILKAFKPLSTDICVYHRLESC